jgi:hypothetical protein
LCNQSIIRSLSVTLDTVAKGRNAADMPPEPPQDPEDAKTAGEAVTAGEAAAPAPAAAPAEAVSPAKEWAVARVLMALFALICAAFVSFWRGV